MHFNAFSLLLQKDIEKILLIPCCLPHSVALFIPQVFAPKWSTDNLLPVLLKSKGLLVWYHLLLLSLHFSINALVLSCLFRYLIETHVCLKSRLIPRPLCSGFLQHWWSPGACMNWIPLQCIIREFLSTYSVLYTVPFLQGFTIQLERSVYLLKRKQQPGGHMSSPRIKGENSQLPGMAQCEKWIKSR